MFIDKYNIYGQIHEPPLATQNVDIVLMASNGQDQLILQNVLRDYILQKHYVCTVFIYPAVRQ